MSTLHGLLIVRGALVDVMGTQPSFLFPLHSSAGLPGHSVPAACLLVAREQLVCLYFFLDAGSAPAHHPLLVIAIGTRLHCPSAGFLFFFFFGVRASCQGWSGSSGRAWGCCIGTRTSLAGTLRLLLSWAGHSLPPSPHFM